MEEDQGVAGLVGAGFGIAVVPKMPILSYMPVSIIEIATPSWERLFYMATLKNVYQAPVVMNNSAAEYTKLSNIYPTFPKSCHLKLIDA